MSPRRDTALTRAMVLGAGRGTRMRNLTADRPKPLVEVAGKPLIDHVLDRLAQSGITDAVVNLHYMADRLEAHLAKRTRPRVILSDERDQLLDTGGGVANALNLLEDGSAGGTPFFIQNSDTIWAEGHGRALEHMMRAWRDEAMDGLLLLASTTSATGYSGPGDFAMSGDGRLTRRGEGTVAPFVFAGVSIAHPRLFEDHPTGPFSLNLLWDRALSAGRLHGLRHNGVWMHVGSPEAVREAEDCMRVLGTD